MYSLFLAQNPELFAFLFPQQCSKQHIALCVVPWDLPKAPGAQTHWDSPVLSWASLPVPSCAPQAAFSAPHCSKEIGV